MEGEKSFEATLTAMNELNEIAGQWHGTASLKEAMPALLRLFERNHRLGKVCFLSFSSFTLNLSFKFGRKQNIYEYSIEDLKQ